MKNNVSAFEEMVKSLNVAENVGKSYTPPLSNNDILNQKFGRGLDIDEGTTMVDLVVDQSHFLQSVYVDRVTTMKSTVNVYDGNGALTQTPNGDDPFATAGNLASFRNLGYDVSLETTQFLYRIFKEQLLAIQKEAEWETRVNEQMGKVFANLLVKQAMFGVPSTGGDTDIEHGYNYVGTVAMGAPRIGLRGWLDLLKRGYTYKQDGATKTATVGAVVNTYDTVKSEFKAINTILEEIVKSYPAEFDGEDVCIMLSRADFIDFAFYVAGRDASTAKYETGKVYEIGGYRLMIVPFLQPASKVVTISGSDYYPGFVMMGREKDLIIKMNVAGLDIDSTYYPKLRTLDTIYDIPIAFGAIIQRFCIAYRVR